MLNELFQAILKTGQEAQGARVMESPDTGPGYWMQHDGELKWQDRKPAPSDHKARSLETLTAFAMALADHAEQPLPVVWYSRAGVVLLVDDSTRRDRVTVELVYSRPLNCLADCNARAVVWSQKDFIRILRTTFADCLGSCGEILRNVRTLQFNRSEVGNSSLQQGKASLGKKIESEVTGYDLIPDYLTFQVPVFEGGVIHLLAGVRCALEVDPATATFQLIPLPGQIERAIAEAEDVIAEQLIEALGDKVPVYYGVP